MSMFEGPNLRLYDGVLDKMLNSKSGEVGRYMRRISQEIIMQGKAMVRVRSGRLRASIHLIRHDRWARGQLVEVGSNLSYAYLVHEGAKPHVILPTKGRTLIFNVHGRRVFAHRVQHPGFRGRKYLTTPMRRVVTRR